MHAVLHSCLKRILPPSKQHSHHTIIPPKRGQCILYRIVRRFVTTTIHSHLTPTSSSSNSPIGEHRCRDVVHHQISRQSQRRIETTTKTDRDLLHRHLPMGHQQLITHGHIGRANHSNSSLFRINDRDVVQISQTQLMPIHQCHRVKLCYKTNTLVDSTESMTLSCSHLSDDDLCA